LRFLLINIKKNPDVGPKNVTVVTKKRSPGRIFENVSKFLKAQRSTLALAVVREIACVYPRDAPVRLPTKSASTKRAFHLQHVANLKKSPGIMSAIFQDF
jgi:hypothetical protein